MRVLYPVFGGVAYLVFFATFLYLIAFTGDLPWVQVTVDSGPTAAPIIAAAIDLALIALFGLQHSVMARKGFKAAWTRLVPEAAERSVYVLLASLMLIAMFVFWRPLPGPVWTVENEAGEMALWAIFGLGWLIVLVSTFLLNHFELFGLQQVWNRLRGKTPVAPVFRTPLFYKHVRHPLYSGFILAFWATPKMTIGHLLLATGMTAYILVAIAYEEKDLIALFGDQYRAYKTRAGMLIPKWRAGG